MNPSIRLACGLAYFIYFAGFDHHMLKPDLIVQIQRWSERMTQSIAFYPVLLGVLGVVLAVAVIYFDSTVLNVSDYLRRELPIFAVPEQDGISGLMTFLAGSVLSMMVFSFSMVMLLLNQAANRFSPRVLPSLTGVKKHQLILGLYLAAVFYDVIVTIAIKPDHVDLIDINLAVWVGVALSSLCFVAFIYFIDSISRSIRVDSVLTQLHHDTALQLSVMFEAGLAAQPSRLAFVRTSAWQRCESHQTGYLGSIHHERLLVLCKKHDVKIEIHPFRGQFVFAQTLLFEHSRPLTDEVLAACRGCFYFSRDEREALSDNHLAGFQQLAEIGVRAMSPGINDPMTAVATLDVLTELFAQRWQCSPDVYWGQSSAADAAEHPVDQVWIFMKGVSHTELLYQVMVSYRRYCAGDVSCLQSMLRLLGYLYRQPSLSDQERHDVMAEAARVREDARLALQNPYDLYRIEQLYAHIPQPSLISSD